MSQMKSPFGGFGMAHYAGPALTRQKAAILAALLGMVPLAAASAGPAQTLTAAEVRCDPVDTHPRQVAQVRAKEAPLSYSVQIPAEIIETGRPVDFKLTIENDGATPATLSFSTSQLYEIVVWDDRCTEVWRWSHGLAFAQVITSISVQRERPLFYSVQWQRRNQAGQPVRSGTYVARVVFLGQSAARHAPLVFPQLIFDLQ